MSSVAIRYQLGLVLPGRLAVPVPVPRPADWQIGYAPATARSGTRSRPAPWRWKSPKSRIRLVPVTEGGRYRTCNRSELRSVAASHALEKSDRRGLIGSEESKRSCQKSEISAQFLPRRLPTWLVPLPKGWSSVAPQFLQRNALRFANRLRVRQYFTEGKIMKKRCHLTGSVLSVAIAVLSAFPASAQQITGVPGSPSATTTIDGKNLPPPPRSSAA